MKCLFPLISPCAVSVPGISALPTGAAAPGAGGVAPPADSYAGVISGGPHADAPPLAVSALFAGVQGTAGPAQSASADGPGGAGRPPSGRSRRQSLWKGENFDAPIARLVERADPLLIISVHRDNHRIALFFPKGHDTPDGTRYCAEVFVSGWRSGFVRIIVNPDKTIQTVFDTGPLPLMLKNKIILPASELVHAVRAWEAQYNLGRRIAGIFAGMMARQSDLKPIERALIRLQRPDSANHPDADALGAREIAFVLTGWILTAGTAIYVDAQSGTGGRALDWSQCYKDGGTYGDDSRVYRDHVVLRDGVLELARLGFDIVADAKKFALAAGQEVGADHTEKVREAWDYINIALHHGEAGATLDIGGNSGAGGAAGGTPPCETPPPMDRNLDALRGNRSTLGLRLTHSWLTSANGSNRDIVVHGTYLTRRNPDITMTRAMAEAILDARAEQLGKARGDVIVVVGGPGHELLEAILWQELGARVIVIEGDQESVNYFRNELRMEYPEGLPNMEIPDFGAAIPPGDIVQWIHPKEEPDRPVLTLEELIRPLATGGILIVQTDLVERYARPLNEASNSGYVLLDEKLDDRHYFLPSIHVAGAAARLFIWQKNARP